MIEKCSSPIGDGNRVAALFTNSVLSIEKCSSPIGDGNWSSKSLNNGWIIEKCSSPIGDGNADCLFSPVCVANY